MAQGTRRKAQGKKREGERIKAQGASSLGPSRTSAVRRRDAKGIRPNYIHANDDYKYRL